MSIETKIMEDIYILNHDCISNFEIASQDIYFSILNISKKYYLNVRYLTKLYYSRDYSSLKISNLYYFCNLTNLQISSSTFCSSEYSHFGRYVTYYLEEYNKYPPLKILRIEGQFIYGVSELTNLIELEIFNCENILTFANLTNLTFLKFMLHDWKKINDLSCLHQLKVLNVSSNRYFLHQIHGFSNLIKLELSFPRCLNINPGDSCVNIRCYNLTSLSVQNNSSYLLRVQLNALTKLQILNLNCIHIDDNAKYFRIACGLKSLMLTNISKSDIKNDECFNLSDYMIALSDRYNYNLKHLELNNFEHVWLDKLTRLQTNNMQNINILKIDDYASINIR